MKKTFKISELNTIASELLENIAGYARDRAVIIAMSGELGSGKTTLTQEVSRILGITDKVISPTFVILKNYKTTHAQFRQLVHIDAYRLDSSMQLIILGWIEVVGDKNNLIILEWPERVPECLKGGNVCYVKLSHIDEETREI